MYMYICISISLSLSLSIYIYIYIYIYVNVRVCIKIVVHDPHRRCAVAPAHRFSSKAANNAANSISHIRQATP